MGLTHEVDESAGIVLERWVGHVGIKEFADHVASMLRDKQAMACRGNLADLTECKLGFTGEQLGQLVQARIEPSLRGSGRRIAVLVGTPVQYGVARQFGVFAEALGEVEIFTDAAESREWMIPRLTPA